jgi:hypothetical protein
MKVGKIVNFTEPNSATGVTISNVTWTPAVASIDPWAEPLLAAKKLPSAQRILDQITSASPQFTAALDLTNKGWEVGTGGEAGAESSAGGAGQDSASTGQAAPPASPPATIAPGETESPVAAATESPAATESAQLGATPTPLAPPASSDVRPFRPVALLAAFAALPGSALTQGDGVTFALWSAKKSLDFEKISKDFADEFAAHRNADRYLPLLKSHATPMGLSSEDIPVELGSYDFTSKSFPIELPMQSGGILHDDGGVHGWYSGVSPMPDGSAVFFGQLPELTIDNDNLLPRRYSLDSDRAEGLQKAMEQNQYSLTEHLVFYPVAISRHQSGLKDGQIDAVVHVIKFTFERRPSGAPITAVPTILLKTDLQ